MRAYDERAVRAGTVTRWRVASVVALVVGVVGAVCAVRAARMVPYRVVAPPANAPIAGAEVTTARFAAALRFPTVSTEDPGDFDPAPFLALHEYLRTAYPRVQAALTREVVGGYSLLYTWRGADSLLPPLLLMAHLDVVPVERGTEARWTHAPFAGDVAGGYVWGRGAFDDKASLIAILEAVDLLLAEGYQPRRTVYLAFGHDEEVGGAHGAELLAQAIARRTPHLEMLVDEGGVVSRGVLPGVPGEVAMVGVAEKGAIDVELTVDRPGGHSSLPPAHTAVGILSRAIVRLEAHPMPARLTPVTRSMLTRVAPEMRFVMRLPLANLWLFRPVIVGVLSRDARVGAVLRTTTAATMISGSPKANVLPGRARAIVNFRILPGDTRAGVLEHVRRVVDDTSVHISSSGGREASPVTDFRAPAFVLMERTIEQLFPGAVPVPFLMIGGTDTRHYESLTKNVFRFNPFVATSELISGAHGTNERLREGDFARGAKFFAQLIRNAQ